MTDTIDTKAPTIFTFHPAGRDEPVDLRTTTVDGKPWFVARDVLEALDLTKNATRHTEKLKEEHKRLINAGTFATEASSVAKRGGRGGLHATTRLLCVSEPGLYALIQRSDKPEARAFQDWVNEEVLPSIRKTGGYLLNEAARETAFADNREAMPLPMDIAEALAKFSAAQEETNRLLAELLATQRGLTPKTEKYLSARELVAMGIGRGLSASEVGYALTVYCRTHQIGIKRAKGAVGANRYPLSAAKDWSKTV